MNVKQTQMTILYIFIDFWPHVTRSNFKHQYVGLIGPTTSPYKSHCSICSFHLAWREYEVSHIDLFVERLKKNTVIITIESFGLNLFCLQTRLPFWCFDQIVSFNRFSVFWLRSKCSCYTFDLSWGGGWWVFMPGPTAFCQYRQKVHESARGDPLVPQWEIPNWVYCMYKRQKGEGVL